MIRNLKRLSAIFLCFLLSGVVDSQDLSEIVDEFPPYLLSGPRLQSSKWNTDNVELRPAPGQTRDAQEWRQSLRETRTGIVDPDLLVGANDYYEAIAEAIRTDLLESEHSLDVSGITAENVHKQLESWQQQRAYQSTISHDVSNLSVAEAVAQLSENEQATIAGYQGLLENKSALYNVIHELPADVRRVALEVISIRYHPQDQTVMQELLATLDQEISAARLRGYTVSEQRSLPDRIMDRINYQTTTPFGDTIFSYQPVEEFEQNTGTQIPFVPSDVIPTGTSAYIGPWSSEGAVLVYADSVWGASLVVTQATADEVAFSNPNFTVFGRDASVDLIWHEDGEWSTMVAAFDGERDHSIHVGTRLDGSERDLFVNFAKQFLESNYSTNRETVQLSQVRDSTSRSELEQWTNFLSWELLPADTQRAVMIFGSDDHRYPTSRGATFLQAERTEEGASVEIGAAIDRGYSVDLERIPLPEMFLSRIYQLQQMNIEPSGDSLSTTVEGLQNNPPVFFQSIEAFERSTGNLAPRMPEYIVDPGTDAHIGVWDSGGTGRVYADSVWGAPLVVTKTPVDRVVFNNPNLSIFGRDAVVDLVRYQGSVWSTYVTAFDGQHAYRVEIAAKLEGEEKDEFARFAKDIVEYP